MSVQNRHPKPRPDRSADGAATGIAAGLQQLLRHEAKAIAANTTGSGKGDVEALHRLRIAIRRSRALLRTFRKYLPGGRGLDKTLGVINRDLGRLRDFDTWMEFLERCERKGQIEPTPVWRQIVQYTRKLRQKQVPPVRQCLRSRRFREAQRALARLATGKLSTPNGAARKSFASVAAKRLLKKLRSLKDDCEWLQHHDRETIHRARRRYRRARYLAEFFALVLGSPATRLRGALRSIERPLGRAHDMDFAKSILEVIPQPPADLEQHIWRRRRKSIECATKALRRVDWNQLENDLQRAARPLAVKR